MRTASSFAGLLLLVLAGTVRAGDWGLDVFGFSYHMEQSRAKELGVDNQVNPGLGARYRIRQSESWDWITDVGAYHDSGRHTALFAGTGAYFPRVPRFNDINTFGFWLTVWR